MVGWGEGQYLADSSLEHSIKTALRGIAVPGHPLLANLLIEAVNSVGEGQQVAEPKGWHTVGKQLVTREKEEDGQSFCPSKSHPGALSMSTQGSTWKYSPSIYHMLALEQLGGRTSQTTQPLAVARTADAWVSLGRGRWTLPTE